MNIARGHYITRNVFEILLKKLNIDSQLAGLHEESSRFINAGNKTLTQHLRIKYIYMRENNAGLIDNHYIELKNLNFNQLPNMYGLNEGFVFLRIFSRGMVGQKVLPKFI